MSIKLAIPSSAHAEYTEAIRALMTTRIEWHNSANGRRGRPVREHRSDAAKHAAHYRRCRRIARQFPDLFVTTGRTASVSTQHSGAGDGTP